MSKKVYIKTDFTGGAANALDSIDGNALVDGDIAFVFSGNRMYVYQLDADYNQTESSPYIITPNSAPSTKRWVLQSPAVVTKTTAGDPAYVIEGLTVINTYDRTVRMYAAGAWRELGTLGASPSVSPSASPSTP